MSRYYGTSLKRTFAFWLPLKWEWRTTNWCQARWLRQLPTSKQAESTSCSKSSASTSYCLTSVARSVSVINIDKLIKNYSDTFLFYFRRRLQVNKHRLRLSSVKVFNATRFSQFLWQPDWHWQGVQHLCGCRWRGHSHLPKTASSGTHMLSQCEIKARLSWTPSQGLVVVPITYLSNSWVRLHVSPIRSRFSRSQTHRF